MNSFDRHRKWLIGILAVIVFYIIMMANARSEGITPLYLQYEGIDNYLYNNTADSIKIGSLWLVDVNGDGKLDSARIGAISYAVYADSTNKALRDAAGNIITSTYAQLSQLVFQYLNSADTAYMIGTTDTAIKVVHDGTNDSTVFDAVNNTLIIRGGPGTPKIDFGNNVLDSTMADSLIEQKGAYKNAQPDYTSIDTTNDGKLKVIGISDDFQVGGNLEVTGIVGEWQLEKYWDYENILSGEIDTPIAIIPSEFWFTDSATNANQTVHWSLKYIPDGYPTGSDSAHKYILFCTPYAGGASSEMPCLFVGDDGLNFREYISAAGDTVANPIFRDDGYVLNPDFYGGSNTCLYTSDVNQFRTLDDSLGLLVRAYHGYQGDTAVTYALWISLTSDLETWTDSVVILKDTLHSFMSPSVEMIDNSSYFLFSVDAINDDLVAFIQGTDTTDMLITRHSATAARGPWTMDDTMIIYPPIPSGTGSPVLYNPWHISTRVISQTRIAFVITGNNGLNYLGEWDMGRGDTIFIDTIPITPPTDIASNSGLTYKSDLLIYSGENNEVQGYIYTSHKTGAFPLRYKLYKKPQLEYDRAVIDFTTTPVVQNESHANHTLFTNTYRTVGGTSTYWLAIDSNETTSNNFVSTVFIGSAPCEMTLDTLYVTFYSTDAAGTKATGLWSFTVNTADTAGSTDASIRNFPVLSRYLTGYSTYADTGWGSNQIGRRAMPLDSGTTTLDAGFYTFTGERILVDLEYLLYGNYAKMHIATLQIVGRKLPQKLRQSIDSYVPMNKNSSIYDEQ